MLVLIGQVASLLKLRIGVAIAASAIAGMVASAGPAPSVAQATLFALAVLGGAGAAGAFNHYYERDIDIRMARTRNRPFAAGDLRANAWWLVSFGILLSASLALALATGGAVAAIYVFLGAFTYGVVYTVWMKRQTAWNIVVGGLAGSFAVMAGAAAVDPAPQAIPFVLAVVMFLWTPPHFWSLAAARRDDYAAAGVPMLPVVASDRVWSLDPLAHGGAGRAVIAAAGLRHGAMVRRRGGCRRRLFRLAQLGAVPRSEPRCGDEELQGLSCPAHLFGGRHSH
jgi:protoheme IX farnesyltransferase